MFILLIFLNLITIMFYLIIETLLVVSFLAKYIRVHYRVDRQSRLDHQETAGGHKCFGEGGRGEEDLWIKRGGAVYGRRGGIEGGRGGRWGGNNHVILVSDPDFCLWNATGQKILF